jgi:Ni,Fe-hydrogenase III large subunit
VGDLGALSGDVAFLPPANYCGRMRGDFLNMSLWMCGNRFGKGLVRPGGVRFPVTDDNRKRFDGTPASVNSSPRSSIPSTCSFPPPACAPVSKAAALSVRPMQKRWAGGPSRSGLRPCLRCAPMLSHGALRHLDIPEHAKTTGDVYARARMSGRRSACNPSRSFKGCLKSRWKPIAWTCLKWSWRRIRFVVTLNEAWRGEVSHCILTDASGKVLGTKIKDPSFHNWNGLAMSCGIRDIRLSR